MRREDDKDHYANKRLKLAGDLMEDLFRVAFANLVKDLKYQLERSYARRRELKISSAIRPDLLTQRLLHALATGNWVGGRAGVSQLLDRTSNMSALSHLRRVTSPLTRSQPHFEARDLHPTQWGRLCPNETPEGQNCGLVKNCALVIDVSEGFPEEEVKLLLADLGTKQVKGQQTQLTRVYVNGDLVGLHEDPKVLVAEIRERRRSGLLSHEVNVRLDENMGEIIINCDEGRIRRPLLTVKAAITKEHSHIEVDPMVILGVASGVVPYPEHNSSPRVTMGAGMAKQSLGLGSSNYRLRPDTRSHLLHYPEQPLVQTDSMKYVSFNERPAGQNFAVAVPRRGDGLPASAEAPGDVRHGAARGKRLGRLRHAPRERERLEAREGEGARPSGPGAGRQVRVPPWAEGRHRAHRAAGRHALHRARHHPGPDHQSPRDPVPDDRGPCPRADRRERPRACRRGHSRHR